MNLINSIVRVVFCFCVASSVYAMPTVQEMCKLQNLATTPLDPAKVLKAIPLTGADKAKLSNARACIKSYGQQYPGDLDALMKDEPSLLKANLVDLRAAFAKPQNISFDPNNPLSVRMLHIKRGWDKEQVILFGSFFWLRAEFLRGDYEAVVEIVSQLRKEYDISVKQIVWDELQERTYFSSDTLRNMIVSIEYLSKVRIPGISKKTMENVVASYMNDRNFLMPLGNFSLNPDSGMFKGFCKEAK